MRSQDPRKYLKWRNFPKYLTEQKLLTAFVKISILDVTFHAMAASYLF